MSSVRFPSLRCGSTCGRAVALATPSAPLQRNFGSLGVANEKGGPVTQAAYPLPQ
jgi:hypothetical protein